MKSKITFTCLECGKVFKSTSNYPDCPKCGSEDLEVGKLDFSYRPIEGPRASNYGKFPQVR
jgi:predicted  nucleic acid-binding Zn-ribbon protein